MQKIIITLFMVMAMALNAVAGEVYTLENVTNPNIADRTQYVADPAGLLNAGARAAINSRIDRLRQQTTAEMAVVILPSIGDEDVVDFATDLYQKWGIGKSDNDNGVLFLMVMDQRQGRLATGYGTEGVLTDAVCATILRDEMTPRMKEGDIDGAVTAVVDMTAAALSDPAVAGELQSKQGVYAGGGSPEVLDGEVFRNFVFYIALGMTLVAAIAFFAQLARVRRRDRYDRALMWKNARLFYIIMTLCSLGGGLIFLLLDLWLAHRARNAPRKCRCCGHRMVKLDEETDNDYLTQPEDLEERLDTIDYDVWRCPDCGAIDKYAFPKRQTKYTRCPNCGTVAMRLKGDFVITPPTYTSPGLAERVYECKYCHHIRRDRHTLPKRERGSAAGALAAGAILGAAAGRGGGGGGTFGGGFGGGSTGGGGASGGW